MQEDRDHRTSKRNSSANQIASAQVILRSHSGKRISPEVLITSENIEEYAPSREDAAVARAAFSAAGFEVGDVVGISFSITAPLTRFEQYFGVKLYIDDRGAVSKLGSDAPTGGLELTLDRLPASLAELVIAVVFTPPAELYGNKHSMLF